MNNSSVSQRTKLNLKESFRRWWVITIAGVVALGLLFVGSFFVESNEAEDAMRTFGIIILIALSAIYGASAAQRARKDFWIDFANSIGWTHTTARSLVGEKSLLLNQGSERQTQNVISGSMAGATAEIFEYLYSVGTGKHKAHYRWTIFELKTKGAFPHLYLNRKRNGGDDLLLTRLGLPKVALPAALAEKYELFVPKEYEVEALDIFSPDTLAYLLAIDWEYDLELADGEMVVCRPHLFNKADELVTEFELVRKFAEHLIPKLNRQSFAPIGDLPHRL